MNWKVFEEADNQFPIEYMTEYEIDGYNSMMHSKAAIKYAMEVLGIKTMNVKKHSYGSVSNIIISKCSAGCFLSGDAKYYS